jgi:peptide/nickel transport system permease protein
MLAGPLLIIVSALSFVFLTLTPGDAAQSLLGFRKDVPPEEYPRLRHEMGLDLPLQDQYWRWATHALGGDLGRSLISGIKVTDLIAQHFEVTLLLTIGSMILIVLIGVPMGLVSAVRGGAVGRLIDAASLVGLSLPGFWVGAALIALFAVNLKLLPAVGYVPFGESPSDWLRSLVLPVSALALVGIAAVAKQTREGMLDVLSSEYIRMAVANGTPPMAIYFVHALKNAAIPVVTILGLQAIGLMGGAVLIENVFGLPGLGNLAVSAAQEHDLPLIQGIVVSFTVVVVLINFAIDISYVWLNPRVRVA